MSFIKDIILIPVDAAIVAHVLYVQKMSFIHARLIFIELTGLSVLYPHV